MEPNTLLPDATRMGAVQLVVSRLDRALEFYTHYLGLRVLSQGESSASLTVDGRTALLGLVEQAGARPKPARSTGLYHFAILTPSRVHLARSLRHLLELRYPLQGASDHLVSEAVYLADPDGNGIEIYADRPRSIWPRSGGEVRMATDPLDFDGLMAELHADGGPWQGLPEGTTMGHVHLQVRDIAEAQTFYCDVLGFEVMLRFGPSALFVSAGGYHHHVGLNTWAGIGAPPPPPGSAGLAHYEILVPDVEAVGAARQRLERAGVKHAMSDGGVDLTDPSGNGIRVRVAEPVLAASR